MPEKLKKAVVDVPDFPKKGIVFKDVTPILADAKLFKAAIEKLATPWRNAKVGWVAGIEARGFIFAAAVARELNVGFVPIRKPGKLPRKTFRESYQLEYGQDSLELHQDAVPKGGRVVLIDDVLATGGTARACLDLLKKCQAEVAGVGFFIELGFLKGRDKLEGARVESVITY